MKKPKVNAKKAAPVQKKSSKKKAAQKKKSPKKPAAKKVSPRKTLAKQAHKKGVNEGDMSEAKKSEALRIPKMDGLDLEAKLQSLKKILKSCRTQQVPEHEIQRFLARILSMSKKCGFLLGVDHAIFKEERDHIRLLEASLNQSSLSEEKKKNLVNNLLKLALPEQLRVEMLEQSRNGLSWVPKTRLIFDTDSSEEEIEVQDRSVMTDTLVKKNERVQTEEIQLNVNRTGNRMDL